MKKIIKKIVAVATATMTLFAFSANPHGKYGNQTKASAASYATAFSNSPLVDYTAISPNRTVGRNHAIDTVTIHCVVGQASVERLGEIFAPTSRQASSNYGIGSDGRIGLYCPESDRAWTSSSPQNDNRAITIEVASDSFDPYWVKPEVMQSLYSLLADICIRNGIPQLKWSDNSNDRINHLNGVNMTVHRDFANTACPGAYLMSQMQSIASAVNSRIKAYVAPSTSWVTVSNYTQVSPQHTRGQCQPVYGMVNSGLTIERIEVGIYHPDSWTTINSKTQYIANPHTKSFNLELADNYVCFDTLPIGKYVFAAWAVDTSGHCHELFAQFFDVVDSNPSWATISDYSKVSPQHIRGKCHPVYGIVNSGLAIKKIECGIYHPDSWLTVNSKTQYIANPYTKSFNLELADNYVCFDTLSVGKYVFAAWLTDTSGRCYELFAQYFSVVNPATTTTSTTTTKPKTTTTTTTTTKPKTTTTTTTTTKPKTTTTTTTTTKPKTTTTTTTTTKPKTTTTTTTTTKPKTTTTTTTTTKPKTTTTTTTTTKPKTTTTTTTTTLQLLPSTSLTLTIGQSIPLVVVGSVPTDIRIQYTMSDPSVVEISPQGQITALSSGTAEVYVVVGSTVLICQVQVVPPPTLGDINLDRSVDISDVILLMRFIAEDTTVSIGAQGLSNADMNADSRISNADATALLRFIAGLT